MTVEDFPAYGTIGCDQLESIMFPIDPAKVRCRTAPRPLEWLWGTGVDAMTLGQTILIGRRLEAGDGVTAALLAHELIHARQWHDHGWLGFIRIYLGDYLRSRRSGLSHREAYQAISLEREARHLAALITS